MSNGLNRTSLTPYARQMQDPDEAAARRRAAGAWHADGTVILFPASIERLPWQDREIIEQIVARVYGPREK